MRAVPLPSIMVVSSADGWVEDEKYHKKSL